MKRLNRFKRPPASGAATVDETGMTMRLTQLKFLFDARRLSLDQWQAGQLRILAPLGPPHAGFLGRLQEHGLITVQVFARKAG